MVTTPFRPASDSAPRRTLSMKENLIGGPFTHMFPPPGGCYEKNRSWKVVEAVGIASRCSPGGADECSQGWSAAQPLECSRRESPQPRSGDRRALADRAVAPPGLRHINTRDRSRGCAALHPWLRSVAAPRLQ